MKVDRCEGGQVRRWTGKKVDMLKVGRCEGGQVRRWTGVKVDR